MPGRPLWQLVKKELRLQQLTFALTAWYLVTAWPTATLLRVLGLGDEAASAGAAIYWLCLPVLAGSLASAEERRLGTLSWQFQLPPAARQQWAVKVATVFGVALLVSMVGPLLLAELLWPAARPAGGTAVVLVVLVVVLTAVSLYISSLSASGLRAAVVSLTVVPAIVWLVARWALLLSRTPTPAFWSGRGGGWIGLLSLVVVLLVWLAFLNHRPERPVASLIRRQTLGLAALAAVGIVVLEFLRF